MLQAFVCLPVPPAAAQGLNSPGIPNLIPPDPLLCPGWESTPSRVSGGRQRSAWQTARGLQREHLWASQGTASDRRRQGWKRPVRSHPVPSSCQKKKSSSAWEFVSKVCILSCFSLIKLIRALRLQSPTAVTSGHLLVPAGLPKPRKVPASLPC